MSCTMLGPVAWKKRSFVAFSSKPSRVSSKLIHLSHSYVFLNPFPLNSYLHINGFIHRDIKAANLLIDDDGTVLLGDLGVAAPLHDEDHTHPNDSSKVSRAVIFDLDSTPAPRRTRIGKRRSFVGTPCWMAPELISGDHYDSSADIWSFGITALELAQGRAPRSREPSRTVLSQIVKAAPPTLDREGGVHKYSRAFKELVDRCLVKDPSLRPTAAELLHTPFFKNAKKFSHLVGTILRDLPPLAKRLERRKQASLVLHGTIDSWDFPTTLHFPSPTQTVFHRPRHEDRKSIDERDEKKDVSDKSTGGAPLEFIREWSLSSTTGQDLVGLQSVESSPATRALSASNPPLGDGYPVASSSPEWLFANTSDDAASSSTAESTPISISDPVSPDVPASPPPSSGLWWRRIRRRSTSQSSSKDGSQFRSTFINSVLLGGRGGREAMT